MRKLTRLILVLGLVAALAAPLPALAANSGAGGAPGVALSELSRFLLDLVGAVLGPDAVGPDEASAVAVEGEPVEDPQDGGSQIDPDG